MFPLIGTSWLFLQVVNGVRVSGCPEKDGEPSGQKFDVTVNVVRRSLDQHRMILVMTLINDSNQDKVAKQKRYHMAKEILIQVKEIIARPAIM